MFNAVLENACSEQGARMSAMDSSSRNAGDMLDRLTLTYNRFLSYLSMYLFEHTCRPLLTILSMHPNHVMASLMEVINPMICTFLEILAENHSWWNPKGFSNLETLPVPRPFLKFFTRKNSFLNLGSLLDIYFSLLFKSWYKIRPLFRATIENVLTDSSEASGVIDRLQLCYSLYYDNFVISTTLFNLLFLYCGVNRILSNQIWFWSFMSSIRTRQASITTELTEIISGASALEG